MEGCDMMSYQKPLVAVKYGGSAFKNTEDYHSVVEHQNEIYKSGKIPVCVNSARSGASDRLMKVWNGELPLKLYAQEEEEFFSGVFRSRKDKDAFMAELEKGFVSMEKVLGAKPGKYGKSHAESYVLSHGETETGKALQYLLSDTTQGIKFLDGHDAGIAAKHMRGSVDIKRSVENLRKKAGNFCYGGFVGMDPADARSYMLLDRNSTDVTAALVAAALGADEYWNIKDVDGVYVCDPSLMENGDKPPIIKKLSYGEAANITRSGSQVIHPTGIIVSDMAGVKIIIKSMNGCHGTVISQFSGTTPEKPYAAMSSGIYTSMTVNDNEMDIPGEGRGYSALVSKLIADNGYDIMAPTGPGNSMSIVMAGGSEIKKNRSAVTEDACMAIKRGLWNNEREAEVKGRDVGYITITGEEMRNSLDVQVKIGLALAEEGIKVTSSSYGDTQQVKCPVFGLSVNPEDYRRAVNALLRKLF
jgi:aspartate kinase